MGRKQKKLTEEEIEEYKYENFQMMAAISGKPMSELMGESPNRPNFNENYCIIKQLYLKNCAEPISSKELFKKLQNQGYKAKYSTFRGLTNYYLKCDYIRKINDKKPFLYILTDEGKLHAKNPFILVDENIQRYREFQLHKLKELIENYPELFKNIYESIHSAQSIINNIVAGSGSQYSGAINEYRDKINDDGFLQSLNEDKIKEIIELGDPELLTDFVINLQDYYQRHKSPMIFKQQEYNSKPTGERKYYEYLVNGIDKFVTKPLYEVIPFRFIKVGNQIRLKSTSESGIYRNNDDGTILDFDYVNRNWFQNQMKIKTETNNNELIFYYFGGNAKIKITTMSFSDYNNVKNKKQPTLRFKTSY
ncbi:hypothetical protein [Methanosarcina mazei]|uniref:Uncharacterized protein n=2 Tax=Methanosarcina mazei TaxID=2209 RepID=A0A0F8KWN3_METMZ|nr:hypothetical protein [Methanosarcina mazei]KKG92428.1 hypothetical protein DU66_10540 [Methanosarcina mazei]KKG95454.1 hypothetical protein DU69_06355 [Methanosarcina mazei]KKG95815.1 hypothetical protein DU68_16280 [Methanosarcina mazei]KKH04012.1 hypothetical protein DU56_15935 [Methanosarcina mazei]